ncbi:glycosyltransferase family 2 protein [Entomospira culicis]|uniref:Glycosyltransferase family 2 protein n=1 Tax=Entomospira culicis TaxID=2719989 RepID=A0A968KWD3_9SPIO|nr:glycosyltransferase family 2 protein [Entomospira culicis]NIZ19910.1 glycosyltransferase family 2 protein [Entomospira culicis]NIZ70133.1 glycosyltransferase family 2 protein [Entomospira culicis]WDI38060.1 glycosyltransferase family 2 protein [Entomospira culicis]WDI39683.1 glycosyltransferase family 2 protein [Entomospira culicis]
MLVSIIIPFYNVERYFRACLASIVHQTYTTLEILLIDDCSPDNSLAIAREYAEKDDRIKIIRHEKNLRQGGARNTGLKVASGEYIWFIDSDDEIATPYAVEHLVQVARRDESDVILFGAQGKFSDHKKECLYGDYTYNREYVFNKENPFYTVYMNNILHGVHDYTWLSPSPWMKLFKRSFLEKYHFKFLEHTLYEDIPMLGLLPLAERVTQLPYVFYDYYQREGSTMSSGIAANYVENFERLAQQLWEIHDSYLTEYERSEMIVPVVLMHHLRYNTRRLKASLSIPAYEQWLVEMYDFFKEQLSYRIGLEELNPWPRRIGDQMQWQAVFRSFQDSAVAKRTKVQLIDNVITVKSKKLKKMVKMLMPYGVVRLIQIIKSR